MDKSEFDPNSHAIIPTTEYQRLREIEEAASEVLHHEDTASDHGPGDGAFIDSYKAAFNRLRQALHEGDDGGD